MSPKTGKTTARKPAPKRPEDSVRSRAPVRKSTKKDILVNKKPGKKGGRPPKIDEKVVRKLEAAFCNDFTIAEALDYADVGRSTYYDWLKKSKVFSDRIRKAQQYALTIAKKSMIDQIKGNPKEGRKGDGNLALRFLERRQPERYRPKIDPEDMVVPSVTVILPGDKKHPRFTSPDKSG